MILREGDPTTPPHDGFYLLQSGEVVCHLPEKEIDPSSPDGHTVALRKLATPCSPRRVSGGASGFASGGQGGAAVDNEGEAEINLVVLDGKGDKHNVRTTVQVADVT